MTPVLRGTLATALLLTSFGLGFTWRDLRAGNSPQVPRPADRVQPTQLFAREFNFVTTEFAGVAVDRREVLYSSMNGLVGALGDPHTNFFDPISTAEFNQMTSGTLSFGGIGARLMPDPLGVKVIQVFRNSPAFRAGIRSGDIIAGVDGENVGGQESDEIVTKIKGKVGTTVELRVVRGTQTLNLRIQRARIEPPSAEGVVLEGSNIGYLPVTGFDAQTSDQYISAVRTLQSEGIEGLIIDLRNNGGGLLDQAIRMLATFTEGKLIVTMRERGGLEQRAVTPRGLKHDYRYPVVILINEQSASAAEIFSGALRDYRLATLVGEHTYGKASVQNVIQLSGGTSVKVTIARYFLPSGDDIGRKEDEWGQWVSGGIRPDVDVPLSLRTSVAMGDPKTDNQLQRAMQIVREKNPRAR